ncbi:MAG: MgtC/SapB family protein [Chloroflexi bacterium]|nr:MAG: MgtC/SapB family protein [Chloroflexota bacterium]
MTPELSLDLQLELAGRLVLGLVLGAIIGFERELHRQPAGFRTHSLVSLGAALFTVVSAYGFAGASVDPTRIAAQIVTGIGFIGAGTILQHRGSVRGLTTAASLWSSAAVGMAAGAGLVIMAGIGTLLGIPPAQGEPPDGATEDLP